jgi:hypothetical protein
MSSGRASSDLLPPFTTTDSSEADELFQLNPQQKAYFDTFGYLKIPGLFKDDIEDIIAGFEEVFANDEHLRMEVFEPIHFEQRRLIVPVFIDKSPKLQRLRHDPRVVGIVRSLVGDDYDYAESDGSLFDCDSSWHADSYGAPLERYHLKLSFYLDPLRRDTGAIRVIPGTNHYMDLFAMSLRDGLEDAFRVQDYYGVLPDQIPSSTIESEPGDLIVWSYRTLHASFGGEKRRRLFSISFREPSTAGSGID